MFSSHNSPLNWNCIENYGLGIIYKLKREMARNILLDAPSISKRKGFQKDFMKKNKRAFSKNKKIIPRGEKQERGRFNSGQLQSAALNHAGFPRASRHCIPHRGPTAGRGGRVMIISLPPAPYKWPAFARTPSGTPQDVQSKISITNTELREVRLLGYTQVRFLYPQHKLGNVHKARIISRDQPRCTGLARPQTQKHMQSVRARDEPGGGGEGRGKTGRRRGSFLRALFALETP